MSENAIPSDDGSDPLRTGKSRPWLFALLVAPMAVLTNGLIGGVLSLLLRQQGTGMARTSSIISLLTLTQSIYFLWGPVTDFWIRRKTWLLISAAAASVSVVISFHCRNLASPKAVMALFVSACFGQLIVAACGGMMGTLRSERDRRIASSSYQIGSLAFGAVSIFIIATLSESMKLGSLGWFIGGLVVVPSLASFAATEQKAIAQSAFRDELQRIGREFSSTFLRWEAIPYILLLVLPMGSGAAIGLLPGLATDYHVSSHQVALINGVGGTALTALGALAVVFIPTKLRGAVIYLTVALINECGLGVLSLGPLKPLTYLLGTSVFLFSSGACYSMFTAVVLEFMGTSGRSGSSRFSIINALGNLPVAYMAYIDGLGYARWGPRGLSAADVSLGISAALILMGYFIFFKNRKPAYSGSKSE